MWIKIIVLILTVLLSPTLAWADTEDIECDGVGSPDQWANQGGANKCASISDATDGNFIYELTIDEKQRFTMADPSVVTGDDAINSVKIMWRGADDGAGDNRAQMKQYVGVNSNDGTDQDLTADWTDYEENFALAPDGGAWTLSALNDLQLEAHCTSTEGGRFTGVTRLYARIDYTVGGVGETPWLDKIQQPEGAGKVHDVSDTTRIHHP